MTAIPADNKSNREFVNEVKQLPTVGGTLYFASGELKPWQGYAFAVALTIATLGLRLALAGQLSNRPTLIIFTVPIILGAYLGGLRAGLLATGVSYLGASYYLLPPIRSFWVEFPADRWDLFFLVLAGIGISVLNEALQRARRRADVATRELRERVALVKVEILQTAIFNSENFSSIATDAQGVIQIFNVGAERMLGYCAAEVVNKLTPADISDPDELIARASALSLECGFSIAPGFDALVFKAARGIEDIYELTKIRKDGSRFPAVVSVTALRDANGAIIGYLLIGTDNTARKQVDDALRKSETQLQTIVENISEAVVVSDLNGQLLHFNHAALGMLGYTCLQEARRNFSQLADTFEVSGMDGTKWKIDQWPMARILRGEKLHNVEARMRRIGEDWERAYSFGGSIAHDAGGRPVMAIVTFTDITERQLAESAAVRLAAVEESTADAVFGQDLDGVVTSWNAAAERIFGYGAQEMLGTTFARMLPPDRQQDEQHILSVVKQGERLEHFETERRRKNGDVIHVSVNASPIKDSHGRIIGVSRVVQDITERRQAMAESERNGVKLEAVNHALAKNNQRLSELYLTAQRFMDDVSHEFRTPLSVIKGYSELMHAGVVGPQTPEQMRFSQIIIDRTRDMAQMVDDLLDSSKLRAGSLRVDRAPSDVAAIFAALHPIIDSRVAAGKIVWVEEIDPGLPRVFADAEKVTRVLVNLIVNAIKFSPEGGRIVLAAKLDGDGDVRISVSDQGAGISPESLALIFERFRQVGNALGSTKGFGLGLNIAKELVALNFGKMSVATKVLEGSTFSFTLPLNKPAIILARLFQHLNNLASAPGFFAVLRVTPEPGRSEECVPSELRAFLACSSHPNDVILSSSDRTALILFGYSTHPAGWHDRLIRAGQEIEQFSPAQKIRRFSTELIAAIPYPTPLAEAVELVLRHLETEAAHV